MRFFLLLAAVPLWAAEDANAILTRLVEAEKSNTERTRQYTFTLESQHFDYDKNGQAKPTGSETYEILFVEGSVYNRLVSRNGKPLDKREEAKEEKKMQQTAAKRRKERRSGLFRKVTDLGSNQELLTLFDNHLVGEEEIHGRKAWVIESTPQAGRIAANDHEKDVLSFRKKIWVDQVENVSLKRIDTVIGDQIALKPPTTHTFEFEKVNGDAWMPATSVFDFRIQWFKLAKSSGRTESRYSNYKKFNVESTISVDQPK
jgi:hypothetical protein